MWPYIFQPRTREWRYRNEQTGTCLVVQWLRLRAPSAGSLGSVLGQGTRSPTLHLKILHAAIKTRHSQIYQWTVAPDFKKLIWGREGEVHHHQISTQIRIRMSEGILSPAQLFATLGTEVHKDPLPPLSMGFSLQEYQSGLPFLPAGAFPNPRIESTSPVSPELQADSLPLSHRGSSRNKTRRL